MRIEHTQRPYVVHHFNLPGHQAAEFQDTLEYLFRTCSNLYDNLQGNISRGRNYFQHMTANVRYYISLSVHEIERLEKVGVRAFTQGKNRDQLLKDLGTFEQQVPVLDYQNMCWNTTIGAQNRWDYATSRLFMVLPSDLDSWSGSDPSTHQFRFYFLCDNWKHNGARDDMPQHVHISNHAGYNINQPLEFFQKYGDHALKLLKIFKHGYSSTSYEIPPLDTFKILENCDSSVMGGHLTKNTIGPLLDKAITYLQVLSLPKWKTLGPNRSQIAAIKAHLDVQGGPAEGNLFRYIDPKQDVYWICHKHASQYMDQVSLDKLKNFVLGLRGCFDIQQATLRVDLGSVAEASQFLTLLIGANYTFDIAIKLNWKATQSYVKELCQDIAKTRTIILDIDGITLDNHPQDRVQFATNLFANIMKGTELRLIALRNYPRPQEQCVYTGKRSLQSTSLARAESGHSWVELKADMKAFGETGSNAQEALDCNTTAAREMQAVAAKHGISDSAIFSIINDNWSAVFDLKQGVFVEAYSRDRACPKAMLTCGSLRRFTMDIYDQEFDYGYFRKLQSNTSLQELNISYHAHNLLHDAEQIVMIWCGSSSPLRLTLFDRMMNHRGRVVAQLAIQGCYHETQTDSPLPRKRLNTSADIVILQWDCDQVFSPLTDNFASFLDVATQQHPSVLSLFTLDISWLSRVGLAAVCNILGRSSLEHLTVLCTAFDPNKSDSVSQVLGSVNWSTLKSLVVSGEYINDWIELWPSVTAPLLLSLVIQGVRSAQELSHASVLFVHKLVFASPMVELTFKNVQLQDYCDWALMPSTVME